MILCQYGNCHFCILYVIELAGLSALHNLHICTVGAESGVLCAVASIVHGYCLQNMHDACCPVYIYRCTQLDAIQSQVYLIADSMWHVIQGQKNHAVAMSGDLATMSGAVLPLSPWTS